MNTNICSAIRSREVIRFHYDGGIRVVEPHCHGISLAGNEVLRGYQSGGYSQSGRPAAWKLFEVAKISSLQLTGQTFATNRPHYNPNDSQMTQVHCHV
jgi:hypothetical protein